MQNDCYCCSVTRLTCLYLIQDGTLIPEQTRLTPRDAQRSPALPQVQHPGSDVREQYRERFHAPGLSRSTVPLLVRCCYLPVSEHGGYTDSPGTHCSSLVRWACELTLRQRAVTVTSKAAIGMTDQPTDLVPSCGDPADFVVLNGITSVQSAVLNPGFDRITIRRGVVVSRRSSVHWTKLDGEDEQVA